MVTFISGCVYKPSSWTVVFRYGIFIDIIIEWKRVKITVPKDSKKKKKTVSKVRYTVQCTYT